MLQITIIYADGRFKVLKNNRQIRVQLCTGKIIPVEFHTKEAAEGYVRAYRSLVRISA